MLWHFQAGGVGYLGRAGCHGADNECAVAAAATHAYVICSQYIKLIPGLKACSRFTERVCQTRV
jgi:hypothetical protein